MNMPLMSDYEEKEERPFPEVLDELFEADTVSVPLLFRLSDMSAAQHEHFTERWPDVPARRRQEIARHLADLTEENFVVEFTPVFRYLLDDPAKDVRRAALDGMWDTTNLSVIRPILHLLQTDPETAVRAAAAGALAHFILMAEWGQLPRRILPRIVEQLLAVYEAPETELAVRRRALEALGSSSHERVPDLIDAAYRSGDAELQISAVFAMGASADRRWTREIMYELENPDSEMRIEAARAAGAIGASDALRPLEKLTLDDELAVAVTAVNAIGQIGGELATEILENLANNPQAADLHEMLPEIMEEMSWYSGSISMDMFDFDDDDELLD